jgi:hypothetical protein
MPEQFIKVMLKIIENVYSISQLSSLLIDKYIPQYHYNEYHKAAVKASTAKCFAATKELDLGSSFITKLLMRLRGLPTKDLRLKASLEAICFTYVEEEQDKEFVIDASQRELKIYWNFYFAPISANETMVSTETRILCLTPKSKRKFAVYWFFIKPFSGLIRMEILRSLKKQVKL